MKFRSKFLAVLMTFVLMFSVLGAFSVSATAEDEYTYTKADVQSIADLYGMTFEDALTALGITEEDLADGDAAASSSDAAVSYTDMLAGLSFKTETTDTHGISYKFPSDGTVYSLSSSAIELYDYSGAAKEDLMNNYSLVEMSEYTSELSNAVVYYQISAEEDTPYGKYIGSFNKLSENQKNELIELKVKAGFDEDNTYMARSNGQVYLVARSDDDQMAESGICTTEVEITTVKDDTLYTVYLYVQHGGTASDAAIVDDLIKSVNVKGMASDAVATKTVAVIALCLAGVLLIVIAFLVFFIVRFSVFSKASGSKFNIIGFDMPKKAAPAEKESFKAKSGVKDSLKD